MADTPLSKKLHFNPQSDDEPLLSLVSKQDVFALKLKVAGHPKFQTLPEKWKKRVVNVTSIQREDYIAFEVLWDQLNDLPKDDQHQSLMNDWNRTSALPTCRSVPRSGLFTFELPK